MRAGFPKPINISFNQNTALSNNELGILEPMRIILLLLVLFSNLSLAQYRSKIFNSAIDDLSIYKINLKKAEWPILDELTEATVYDLEFDVLNTKTINAKAEILITNQETLALQELYFHLYPNLLGGKLDIINLSVSGKKAKYDLQGSGQTLLLKLDSVLMPHEKVLVEIDYQLSVPQNFSRNYGLFAYLSDILTIGHAYPLLAVYDDNGWHTETPPEYGDLVYADMSFFHVRIKTPLDLPVVSSGSLVYNLQKADKNYAEIVAGPVRDFFFSASSRYSFLESKFDGITIRSYYLKESERDFPDAAKAVAERILGYAAKGLQVFEKNIGSYPYKNLNFVPIETSALGIEFPSIIAMTTKYYQQGQFSQHLESTTIHELAHQWFYGVIGNDQLNQPWLDESMAQYATLMYYGKVYGSSGRNKFRKSLVDRWHLEALPIGEAVADYSASEYYSLIYGRGPLLIEELSGYLGTIKFSEFLKEYFKREKFRISSSFIFKDIAEDICKCDLNSFFNDNILPQR